ncbi:CKLF-like MARVEL transmembrane domain-containing protein 4 isoform X1 [Onthophagus taurus]|uniref:CKLF-like MARVEL transmembrane domain-containing protein 4 isoform X1 n=1 Tax=Onthophagus taurus TaxID=166361 RepID=UPI0039BEA1CB
MTETVVTVENAPNNNTAKPNEGNGLSFIKLNVEYFKTLPGIIKIIELILGIICMSCASPAYLSGTHWFLFAVTISFISTLIWSFVYLLSIREALNLPIDWLLSEMGITGLFTVFYLLAFVVQISIWSTNELVDLLHLPKVKNIIAGVIAILNTAVYIFGTILLYKEWKLKRSTDNGPTRGY